jgi:hypothetical protein
MGTKREEVRFEEFARAALLGDLVERCEFRIERFMREQDEERVELRALYSAF